VPPSIPQKYLKIDPYITARGGVPPLRPQGKSKAGPLPPHQFLLIFDAFLTATGTGTPPLIPQNYEKIEAFVGGKVGKTEPPV